MEELLEEFQDDRNDDEHLDPSVSRLDRSPLAIASQICFVSQRGPSKVFLSRRFSALALIACAVRPEDRSCFGLTVPAPRAATFPISPVSRPPPRPHLLPLAPPPSNKVPRPTTSLHLVFHRGHGIAGRVAQVIWLSHQLMTLRLVCGDALGLPLPRLLRR